MAKKAEIKLPEGLSKEEVLEMARAIRSGESQDNLPEGVSEEMMAAWKERYGAKKVRVADVAPDSDTPFLTVVRAPGRPEMSEWEKWTDKNPDKAKEILVNTCCLWRKDEIKANDDLFFATFEGIAQLMPITRAVLKN